ncbi:hypothetical protein [Longimicrobium sp.]|uniref:hypothetical protein n=1 Tax=Longimicrobium sp. TaxID=2029185 RepID=UPI002BAE88DC|nr:hypothetical protein [Longimicrobium sp.]HSU16751.1 hypothetical protein [Longimicrobium sp.]
MKKLTLALEDLAVDSFDTAPVRGGRGTVEARSGTTYADESCNGTCAWTCYPATCATCDYACGGSGVSCGGGCGSGGATCGSTCDYATCAQPESCWMNIC